MTNTLFLVSLAAQKYPADTLTDALVHDIAGMQRMDGSWFGGGTQRPPIEYSPISETAYAIRALRVYASPGRKAEIDRRIARARDWLLRVVPQHTEERVMQALGLHWADAKPPRELAEALMLAQKPNGGWAQRADFPGDAYATGEVLYALNQACGIPITHPAFLRSARPERLVARCCRAKAERCFRTAVGWSLAESDRQDLKTLSRSRRQPVLPKLYLSD
jgi:hypothetical protein